MGQVPWLSLLPCLGKYPAASAACASPEHSAGVWCTQPGKENSPESCNKGFFFSPFPFAQLTFPVLIVSEDS